MNSKEALNEIKHIVDSSKRPQNFNGKKYLECMTKIEKDLEVLKIIKTNSVDLVAIRYNKIKNNDDYNDVMFGFEKRKYKKYLTEQEFKLIKDWLDRKEEL